MGLYLIDVEGEVRQVSDTMAQTRLEIARLGGLMDGDGQDGLGELVNDLIERQQAADAVVATIGATSTLCDICRQPSARSRPTAATTL